MVKNVLIGYYTKTGTTSKICDLLKMRLSSAGFLVEMKEFANIKNLDTYDIVILAAPINGMQWVEPAKQFLLDFEDVLKTKRVIALFVSYIIRHGNKFWRKKIVSGIEALTKTIKPIVIKDFGGVVDKEFPAFARMIFGIKKGTSPDASDPNEVELFAKELIELLEKE